MNLNPVTFSSLKTIGEHENMKKCWPSRDEHFDCLDGFTDRYGNSLSH